MSDDTREERLESALQRIAAWANEAYPVDVFVPQDLKMAGKVLADHGISMSAIHGQWAPHLIGGIGEIARDALNPDYPDACENPPQPPTSRTTA